MENEKLKEYLEKMQGIDIPGKAGANFRDYENGTFMLISKVAYLIGVDKKHFENMHEPPQLEWYEQLSKDKSARIIRNLCRLRTALEQNYSDISSAMYYQLKNLHSMPEYVPQECLAELMTDGITVEKANCKINQYIIDINKLISDRINNCKPLFPVWVKWEYIKSLFIMPKGTTEAGIKAAADEYYADKGSYPYQVYINWGMKKQGNILYNDKKFVTLLYEEHMDQFTDMSKVTDAGNIAKDGIYKFLETAGRCAIEVDCENSDPYKLYAMLKSLDHQSLLSHICKIVLYDDVHTTPAWQILNEFTEIPIEYVLIERIKENKSLVDMRLATGTCRDFYEKKIDSFILASSDSDYWALISAMPEMKFLVMVESMKCGPDIKNALLTQGITYCYLDDFTTGDSGELKLSVFLSQINQFLASAVRFNINDIVEEAYKNTRTEFTPSERRQIFDRYIKPMKIVFSPEGDATIQLGT